jgi:hypothetical protein
MALTMVARATHPLALAAKKGLLPGLQVPLPDQLISLVVPPVRR